MLNSWRTLLTLIDTLCQDFCERLKGLVGSHPEARTAHLKLSKQLPAFGSLICTSSIIVADLAAMA